MNLSSEFKAHLDNFVALKRLLANAKNGNSISVTLRLGTGTEPSTYEDGNVRPNYVPISTVVSSELSPFVIQTITDDLTRSIRIYTDCARAEKAALDTLLARAESALANPLTTPAK